MEQPDTNLESMLRNPKNIILKSNKPENSSMSILPQTLSIFSIRAKSDNNFYVYKIIFEPQFLKRSGHSLGFLLPIQIPDEVFDIYPYNLCNYYGLDLTHDSSAHGHNETCRKCEFYRSQAKPDLLEIKKFNTSELLKIQTFHIILYSILASKYPELLQRINNGDKIGIFGNEEITEMSICAIPIKNDTIDWDVIESTINFITNPNDDFTNPVGKVAVTSHINEFFILLEKIPDGLDYEFEVASKHKVYTIQEYYEDKYGFNFTNTTVFKAKCLGTFRQVDKPKLPRKDDEPDLS